MGLVFCLHLSLSSLKSDMAHQKNEIWGHPRGLALLFFTEMWERFSYYGMRALFSLYMINALLFSKAKAAEIYGSYTGLVYLTPLIGGFVADRYWGNRKSIVAGGLLMAIGQFLLFFSATNYESTGIAVPLMWGGLIFLIVGNGFFKPNISSMLGQMYSEGDRRRDAAYTIFYMGINLGAFIAPLVCGALGDTGRAQDFKWGFLAAGIGMILGTILFQTQKDKYVVTPEGKPIGATPNQQVSADSGAAAEGGLGARELGIGAALLVGFYAFFRYYVGFDWIGGIIYAATIAIMAMLLIDKSLTRVERDRIIVIFVAAFFVIFFWAAFEQAGASLTFFAKEQTNRDLFGWKIPTSYFQAINAVAVVSLAPLTALLWARLNKAGKEPNSLVKQSLGLIILALGYVLIAIGVQGLGLDDKKSMFWLIALYVIHTVGELFLSPIGLSLVSKLSPVRFVSLLFGVWFLSNALANKAAGQLSGLYPPSGGEFKIATDNGISRETYRKHLDSDYKMAPAALEAAKKTTSAFEDDNGGDNLLGLVRKSKIGEMIVNGKDTTYSYRLIGINEEVAQKARSLAKPLPVQTMSDALHANLAKLGFNFEGKMYLGAPVQNDSAEEFLATKSIELGLPMNYPTFLGSKVTNLYQFFLIFVVMSGIAGLILFGLSFPLKKMMHGAD
jgi:proton-dependent oligopeptide transporter, POT family